jgi:tetratricopeptide (TPR) repeat protein
MTVRSQQLFFVIGAVALTAVLYFAPRKVDKMVTAAAVPSFSFESLNEKAKQSLKRQEAEEISALEKKVKANTDDVNANEELAKRWDAFHQPGIAAYYFEAVAEKKPEEKNWLNAAYRYFDAFQSTEDSVEKRRMVDKATAAYEKVIQINPKNLDAKTDLGICYVEGSGEPMKGIMMLREVIRENPNHENAQFNLGVLSMKSGQYAKAVERFEKVLQINPERKEMYLAMGRAWMMAGNKDKAKENFERLKKETTNPGLVGEANNYINQISNN